MDLREQKGIEIAASSQIERVRKGWIVPSQSFNGTYLVSMTPNGPACTCPDYELRGGCCKHGHAVKLVIKRTTAYYEAGRRFHPYKIETTELSVTYPQNWSGYNMAQTREKAMFCHLLYDLCRSVPEAAQQRGRPRIPLPDALFSACFKVYSGMSSRRFMTDLRDAQASGYVAKPWHFNTVLKCIEDETLTGILHNLVTASAMPLRSLEDTFAVDSTGFGTQNFYRHYSAKYGHDQMSRDWLKLHAMIGTTTNVIAAVRVTERNEADSPNFLPLVEDGMENFNVQTVTADKAYNSRGNIEGASLLGTQAIIPFRMNQAARRDDSLRAQVWLKLFHLFSYQRDEFLSRYHVRSNAESTFSAMKRVFGDTLRSKTRTAQRNELLLKVIAYNIVCVVHSIFELGVPVPGFGTCPQNAESAHNVSQ